MLRIDKHTAVTRQDKTTAMNKKKNNNKQKSCSVAATKMNNGRL